MKTKLHTYTLALLLTCFMQNWVQAQTISNTFIDKKDSLPAKLNNKTIVKFRVSEKTNKVYLIYKDGTKEVISRAAYRKRRNAELIPIIDSVSVHQP